MSVQKGVVYEANRQSLTSPTEAKVNPSPQIGTWHSFYLLSRMERMVEVTTAKISKYFRHVEKKKTHTQITEELQ